MTKRKFYKTTIMLEVLSETHGTGSPVFDAEWADAVSWDIKSQAEEEVDGKTMAALLEAQRSDPGFFDLTPDGSDVGEADDLLERYEEASGNTVKGNVIVDGDGRVICAPGGNPVLYTDDLAREYLGESND